MTFLVSICLLLTTLIYVVLFGLAWGRKRSRVSMFFALLMFLAAVWAITAAVEINVGSLAGKVRNLQIRLLFITFIPFAWTGLVLALTGKLAAYRKPFIGLALLVAIVTSFLVLTTTTHEWFRYDFSIATRHGLQVLVFERSGWDVIHEVSNHVISLVGFLILLSAWSASNRLLRRQIVILAISFIVPLTGNILFVFRILPPLGINPTPFLLLPASLLQAWVVFRYRVLDILPLARSLILEHLDVGVLVLSLDRRIIDINQYALQLIGVQESRVLGQLVSALPEPWDSLQQSRDQGGRLIEARAAEWSSVQSFPISNNDDGVDVGELVLLKEATSEVLRAREEEAQKQIQEQARQLKLQRLLLRDIHDGIGGLAANLSYMSVLARREHEAIEREKWMAQVEETARQINVEIHDLMNSLESTTMTWSDLVASLRRSASILFMDEGLETSFSIGNLPADDEMGIAEGLSLSRMAREIMNNIVKHAGANRVQMRIDVQERCLLEISDNGCGFDCEKIQRKRGLKHLQKRAEEMGGACHIASSGKGTTVSVSLPVPLHIVSETSGGLRCQPE